MSYEQRRVARILLVGAIVGAVAGFLNYIVDSKVKKATKA